MTDVFTPDLALSQRFLQAYPPDPQRAGQIVLCAVTGAHLYGFPSPDSDLDLKGLHAAPPQLFWGLTTPTESYDKTVIFEDVECDVTTQELAKGIRLLMRGNGNMLERLLSPFQVLRSETTDTLADLARAAIHRGFWGHYRGFFSSVCRLHLKETDPETGRAPAKRLLYAYRTALTGTHLLKTGELCADLRDLAEPYGFPEALELAAYKTQADEKALVDAVEDARHQANWPKLEALLLEAREASTLPPSVPNADAWERWLVDFRRAAL